MLEQLDDEVLLIEQNVHIEFLKLEQLLDSLNVGVLAGEVQRSCQLLDMPLFVLFVLLVVLELVHAYIGCLDRINWEEVQDVIIILLYGHREAFLKHEVEPVRLLNELNTAIWAILLHPLDEHGGLLRLLFELVLGLLLRDIVLELLLGAPQTANVLLGARLLSRLSCTDVRSLNRFNNGHI